MLFSFGVLLLACALFGDGVRASVLWMPIILFPLLRPEGDIGLAEKLRRIAP